MELRVSSCMLSFFDEGGITKSEVLSVGGRDSEVCALGIADLCGSIGSAADLDGSSDRNRKGKKQKQRATFCFGRQDIRHEPFERGLQDWLPLRKI